MARRPRPPLQVYLKGRIVGRVHRGASGAVDFRYDESWLGWPGAIPVSISLPLREDRYIGAPVIAVLDNLLPDNPDIRRRVAARVGAEGSDAFSLLSAIGRDCVGALQFLPDGEELRPASTLIAREVSDEEIAVIIGDLTQSPLGVGGDGEFRISLAGAQEKTALLWNDGHWHIPHGATPTTHIIKPEIGRLRNGIDLSLSVENEYLCLELVRALGLHAAKAEMALFGERKALVVQRFDRHWTNDNFLLRLPQEDCCQALSFLPSLKYESEGGPGIEKIAELLKGSDTPEADRDLFLKAQMVFWLLGATDGHAKNFSIRLAPGGRFRLAPLYDVMSAQPSVDAKQIPKNKMRMAMAAGAKRHYAVETIAGRHFAQTAERCGLPRKNFARMIDELRETTAAAIDETLARLPADFPVVLADSIANGAKARLRVLKITDAPA
jgi:serine/threonine-protein kinase HipA